MHRFFFHNGERKFHPLAIAAFVVGGLALMAALALFFGWIVLLLWNWLMPEIFGLPRIGYAQAWGLVVLSHILVKGGFGHGGHGPHGWKHAHHGRGWRDELKTHFGSAAAGAAGAESSAPDGSRGNGSATETNAPTD